MQSNYLRRRFNLSERNDLAFLVYILCAVTSVLCSALLFRSYARTRADLLKWSAWAFVSFAAANVILVIDFTIVPEVDLFFWRNIVTLLGIFLMLYALIFETD